MSEHPIEGLMQTAMESIKSMVDVNTVVGDAIETQDGTVIIPLSRVALGFAAGGSEFDPSGSDNGKNSNSNQLPFGGGSGAGVSVKPVGFLVCGNGQVRLMPVDSNVLADRIIDGVPILLEQLQAMFGRENAADNSGNNDSSHNNSSCDCGCDCPPDNGTTTVN